MEKNMSSLKEIEMSQSDRFDDDVDFPSSQDPSRNLHLCYRNNK